MKILALAEFDPAGVVLSHRDLLRAAGVDFRVALHSAYTARHLEADYVFEHAAGVASVRGGRRGVGMVGSLGVDYDPVAHDLDDLRAFARTADVVQVHPGIGQPWADYVGELLGLYREPPEARYFGLDWAELLSHDPAMVAFFHGSVHAWHHRAQYAMSYRAAGYALASSTIDYATEMDAEYLPPFVNPPGPLAMLRGDDDPLIVGHCPTNPAIASTAEFMEICRDLGIVVRYAHGRPHSEVLELKRQCHVGFDHLRGCYSVNSLEFAALGCVPLFGLQDEYLRHLEWYEGLDGPPIVLKTIEDLAQVLETLSESPALTRKYQQEGQLWWGTEFNAEALTKRLECFYERL